MAAVHYSNWFGATFGHTPYLLPDHLAGAPLAMGVLADTLRRQPHVLDRVDPAQLQQGIPQVRVGGRLALARKPTSLPPPRRPTFEHRIDEVAVGVVQSDLTGPLQRPQRLDGREQIHAVVGGAGLTTRQILALAIADEQRP